MTQQQQEALKRNYQASRIVTFEDRNEAIRRVQSQPILEQKYERLKTFINTLVENHNTLKKRGEALERGSR
jgi:predicted solute-binding protein